MIRTIRWLLVACLVSSIASAQDTTRITDPRFISSYANSVATKSNVLEHKLDKKAAKALRQWEKQEEKIKRKLFRKDSVLAKQLFADAAGRKEELEKKLASAGKLEEYIPSLDTISTSLKFLSNTGVANDKVRNVIDRVKALESQFKKAEHLKQFLKERKQLLKDQLSKLGFAREIKKLNKQVYYYGEQLKEYKTLLKDKKKRERKALELLTETKQFKDFMRKNSHLASLFRMPDLSQTLSGGGLAGLQTRVQVNNLIQQQIAAGGPNAQQQFRDNLQQAQSQLNQLKDKVLKAGGGSSDDDLPNFKPNHQKTKSFLQRLEYGTNIQTQKATAFFPATTDIGLSLGYKLNDKSIIGIGASYKMGLGRGWNHIRVSHEGIGVRSFIDWKIKGSFYLSGGYEQNYRTAFNSISQLQNESAWQQSGLIGVSKTVAVKSKFFKKTKMQLLWDMLSYQQVPKAQPIVFRIGYHF